MSGAYRFLWFYVGRITVVFNNVIQRLSAFTEKYVYFTVVGGFEWNRTELCVERLKKTLFETGTGTFFIRSYSPDEFRLFYELFYRHKISVSDVWFCRFGLVSDLRFKTVYLEHVCVFINNFLLRIFLFSALISLRVSVPPPVFLQTCPRSTVHARRCCSQRTVKNTTTIPKRT